MPALAIPARLRVHAQSVSAVYALAASTNGEITSGSGDGALRRLSLTPAGIFHGTSPIYSLAAKDGLLAAGRADGKIWRGTPAGEGHLLAGGAMPVFGLHFHADGWLFAAGADGQLRVYGPEASPVASLPVSAQGLRALLPAAPGWGGWLAAGQAGEVYILTGSAPDSLAVRERWPAHPSTIMALAFTPAGHLLTAGRDGHLRQWASPGELVADIAAHNGTIHALAVSACGRYLASGSMDKTFKLWRAETLELLKVVDAARDGHTSSVNALVWQAGAATPTLFTASDDRRVLEWHVDFSPSEG
jgi:WD40 repeat protein